MAYGLLAEKRRRPSSLASELDLSSSTLHFVLGKMLEGGLVDRCRTSPGKRTTYSVCSDTVMAGYDP